MNHVPGRHLLRWIYDNIVLPWKGTRKKSVGSGNKLVCKQQLSDLFLISINCIYRWKISTVTLVPPGIYPENMKALVSTPWVIAPYSLVWERKREQIAVITREVLIINAHNFMAVQAGDLVCYADLVFQPFWRTFIILIEMRKAKCSLIGPINRGMHAILVVCAMGAAVHVHPTLQLDLHSRIKRVK